MAEISSSTYSETDASNNTASPDGWPEGMAMSGINNSGRQMMGAMKRFWSRIQGAYASTGSANAYVVTPTEALAAYVTGERYSFRSSFANTGSATVNISALGAKTIQKMTSAGLANLASGDIQSGQPVTVEYNGTVMIMTTPTTSGGGKIAQAVNTQTGAVATGTTQLPADDTIPQNTEGDQYMSLAITPTNASSTLRIEVVWIGASSAAGGASFIAALFQDSTAGALAAAIHGFDVAGRVLTIKFTHTMTAGTTSATTFKVRAGVGVAGTTTFNGAAGGRLLGGVLASSITITEILP